MNRQNKSSSLTRSLIVLAPLALLVLFGPLLLHGGASSGPRITFSEAQAPGAPILAGSCQRDNGTHYFFSSNPHQWIKSPITTNCAPTGASVTGIDVHAVVRHTCPEVVRVELRYGGVTLVLWNKTGGCNAAYFSPNATGQHTFNGMPVNGTWEFWAVDEEGSGRQHYIEYWQLTVYYGSPTPTATPQPFAMLSGRVYEGSTGTEPPNSTPLDNVRVDLYGSNQPYPNKGSLLATAYTNSDGWYGLGVSERGYGYLNIIQTNLPGYESDGATTAPGGGTVKGDDWIQYTAPLWGQTWTGNKFWDTGSVTDTPPPPTNTPTNTPSPGPTHTPTQGPSPTATYTPTPYWEGTDLLVDKTLIKFAPGPLSPGDSLEYNVLVWNNGPSGAANVVLTDTLPMGLSYSPSSGMTSNNCTLVQSGPPHDVVRCELGDLPAWPQGNVIFMPVTVDEGACGTLTNVAEVHSDTPDPVPDNNTVQHKLEAGPCESPDLRVTKTLVDPPGGVVDVEDVVRFRIEARNLGNAPISGFNLEDTFLDDDFEFVWASEPPSVNSSDGTHRLLVWENQSLPAGGDTAVLLDLRTERPRLSARNCAHYLNPAPAGDGAGVLGPASCVAVQVRPKEGRHVSICKRFTQPSNHMAQLGDWVTFETKWTNIGTVTASSVSVYDHISPPSVSPYLPIQASVIGLCETGDRMELGVKFKTEDVASPAINTAEWTTTWQDETKQTDIVKDYLYVIDGQAGKGLFVTKERIDPIGGADLGDTITFRVSITNVTGFDLPVVSLSDTYPAQCLTILSASTPPDDRAPGIVEWDNVGPLALGASVHIDLRFRADDVCPAALNCARADYRSPDGVDLMAADCAYVNIRGEKPKLWVTKTLTTLNPVTVGDLVEWEIIVENTGPVSLQVVPLHDAYQTAFFDFDSATPAPDSVDLVNGRLDWSNVGPLAPEQVESIIVKLVAKAPGVGATNCAESRYSVGSGQLGPSDCDTVDIRSEGPDIVIEKTRAWPEPHLPLSVGSHLAFTITVHNPGPVQVSNFHVQDFFDRDCVAYVYDTAGNTMFPGVGHLRWDFPPLPPGGTRSWEVVFQATCPHITNCVWADGEGPQGHEVHDEDCSEFDIEHPKPDMRVEKRLVDPQRLPSLGDVIRYEIVVRNTGNVVLDTVPLDDWYDPDCLRFVSALPGPSNVDPATGHIHWNSVGPLAPGDFKTISVFLRGVGICMPSTFNCARATWEENGEVRLDAMDCAEVPVGPPGNAIYLPLIVKRYESAGQANGGKTTWP